MEVRPFFLASILAVSVGAGCTEPAPVFLRQAKADLIRADLADGARIASPVTLTGSARGSWFFEASFPVVLKDGDGREIARVPAHAEGDWMTTSFVNWRATLTFEKPATPTGTLVLQKDNPSGDPRFDDVLEIPVSF